MHTEHGTIVNLIQTAGGSLKEGVGLQALSLTAQVRPRGASEANFCEIFQRHGIHLRHMNDNC